MLRRLSGRGRRLGPSVGHPVLPEPDGGRADRAHCRAPGEAPASPRGAPWARVLEHERIPVVSYPYEWPFAMLRAAAVLHLEVLAAALDEGMSLKDGTAYNVQFVGSRPTFIDVGSFEPSSRPWRVPAVLPDHALPAPGAGAPRHPYQPFLQGSVDGLTASDVTGMFSGLRRSGRACCATSRSTACSSAR